MNQLLDSPPLLSNKVSSADPDYDDATLEHMLYQVHRAQAYHSLREEELINTNFKQLEPKKSNDFFKDKYCSKIWIFAKLIKEVSLKVKSLGSFRVPHSTLLQDEKFVEDQNTILELSGRVQEMQNEVNCMNGSKDFQGAESNTQWKFPRYQSTSVIPTSSNT